MQLIDIHTHVNFNAFKDDSEKVIRRTQNAGIGMILVGSQIDTSQRAVEFARTYDRNVWATVGLHPIHLAPVYVDHKELGAPEGVPGFNSRVERFDYDVYKTLALHPKVVAIGEFGLDYYRVSSEKEIKKLQFETMRAQIRLAREVKKPVMIHCRDAYEDCLRILKEEHADETGGNIHFFAGNWKIAQAFLDFGFYLSFTGVITFANQYDEVIKKMPLNRIMIETDAPYVAPQKYRGKRNEPLYVVEVAKRIAEIRGISYDDVAQATTENAIRLFDLS